MSPTLDRDEIAVRLACALIARDGYDDEGAPRDAVTLADALLRALTPTPAPVAPPAGKYEPKFKDGTQYPSEGERVVVHELKTTDGFIIHEKHLSCRRVGAVGTATSYVPGHGGDVWFVRHDGDGSVAAYAYDELRPAAAGLAVPPQATATCPGCGSENRSVRGWIRVRQVDDLNSDALLASEDFPVSHRTIRTVRCTARFHTSPPASTPAPEAKRPEWVRVIRRGTNAPAFVTNGAVLKVDEWDAVGDPWIDGWCFCGNRDASPSNTIWAPAPCPPPVAGSETKDEAFKALLAYAECDAAYCYGRDLRSEDWRDVFKRHGWSGETADSGEWLKALCNRALALARSTGAES